MYLFYVVIIVGADAPVPPGGISNHDIDCWRGIIGSPHMKG